MELFLIRHGLTEPHAGRCIGQHDVALSEVGKAQMQQLAWTWGGPPPARIITSDLQRATESAASLNYAWKLPLIKDERLREVHFGAWENQLWADLEKEQAEAFNTWMTNWITTAPPSGESFEAVATRVKAWLQTLQAEDTDRIVVVAHAGSIRALLCCVMGMPLANAFQWDIAHARVTILRTSYMGFVISRLNSPRFMD